MIRRTFDQPEIEELAGGETEAAEITPKPKRRRGVVLRTTAVLPTMLTLGNALCGFAAIFVASRPPGTDLPLGWSPVTIGCLFIFLAMVCDGLDGYVARLTRSTSELGEQLDSMADMVSFGIAPAFIVVQLIGVETPFGGGQGDTYFNRLALVTGLIYVACAALRLARFNVELGSEEQPGHDFFKGLPSPGAAGTMASLVLLHEHFLANDAPLWARNAVALVMVAILLLVALAMVSRMRYVHVVNRYIRGRAPFATVVKAVFLGLLLVIDLQATLAAGMVIYALSAPIATAWRRMRKH